MKEKKYVVVTGTGFDEVTEFGYIKSVPFIPSLPKHRPKLCIDERNFIRLNYLNI